MNISKDNLIFSCGMSRSGTTLLTTILDSHSMTHMAYELLPPPIPSLEHLSECLKLGMKLSCGNFSTCGKKLREAGYKSEALIFARCYRAGIDGEDIKGILHRLLKKQTSIQTLAERFEFAWAISNQSARKNDKLRYGFKINAPCFSQALEFFPNSRMIYILRDPRDVVASHIGRNFDRTIEQICKAWNNYLVSFEKVKIDSSTMSLMVKYEELVNIPDQIIPEMAKVLSLEMEQGLLEFYKSKAGIHSYGHPNAENLKKDFFTTSINRWKKELKAEQIREIEDLCQEKLCEYGYN